MPVPVYGFAAQAALEELAAWSTSSDVDQHGPLEMTASVSYTLWRVPDDRADDRNLAQLDPATLESLDEIPLWPRPGWLIARSQQMRYPMVWEAVRTTWQRRGGDAHRSLHRVLAEHMRYIIINRVHAGQDGAEDWTGIVPDLDESASLESATVSVDGQTVSGMRIDVDEHVVGIGTELASGVTVTAVVLRDDLPYFDLALETRWRPST